LLGLVLGDELGHSLEEEKSERGTTSLTQPKLMGNELGLLQGELLLGLALVDELGHSLEEENIGGARLDSSRLSRVRVAAWTGAR